MVRIPGPSTMLSETMPLKLSIAVHTVLHTVTLFSPLGVVPLVHGAYQIAGDPADPLKTDTLAQFFAIAFHSHNWFLLLERDRLLLYVYSISVDKKSFCDEITVYLT